MYKYRLTEEIARWVLEVYVQNNQVSKKHWWIAFTNPTAGPWKRLMAKTHEGMVEAYRFRREEGRPDLVLVNDDLKVVLIIEAKDTHRRLVDAKQMSKSVSVIVAMREQLGALSDHVAWASRSSYSYIPGFLWTRSNDPLQEHRAVTQAFTTATRDRSEPALVNWVIVRDANGNLSPELYVHGTLPIVSDALAASLGLEQYTSSTGDLKQLNLVGP